MYTSRPLIGQERGADRDHHAPPAPAIPISRPQLPRTALTTMLRHVLRASARHAPSAQRFLRPPPPRRLPAHFQAFATQDKPRAVEPPAAQPASADADPDADAAAKASETSEPTQLEALTALVAEKDAELSALNDRTLRVLAEMENVRTIARRDVANAEQYGVARFARGLLDVADNLGLALAAVPEEQTQGGDADPQLAGLYAGVAATERELLKVFSQHGLERFGAVGDAFDPERYQALYEAPAEAGEPGTVVAVQKMGYTIGERVLRPAEVGVAKAK